MAPENDGRRPTSFSGHFCGVYVDDTIIYSRSRDEHLSHLSQMLGALSKAQLKINLKKSVFFFSFSSVVSAIKQKLYFDFVHVPLSFDKFIAMGSEICGHRKLQFDNALWCLDDRFHEARPDMSKEWGEGNEVKI